MYTTLITAEELRPLMQQGSALQVFDCSFELTQPKAGREQYETLHIAGAQYADLDTALSDKRAGAATPSGGRHPLPTPEQFAQWLTSVGVNAQTQVVVYDRQSSSFCGRLWWMLKWVGHEAVAVLDGGLAAWQGIGGATESGTGPAAVPANPPFKPTASKARLLTVEQVAQGLGQSGQTLIDARARARYRGDVEPLDPVAGHIPGALNRPLGLNMLPDGRFKPAEQLRQEFQALLGQRDPASVVHQCGSGVSALPNLLAMEVAGFAPTRLFAGSWSEW